jgi:hypothetical protein
MLTVSIKSKNVPLTAEVVAVSFVAELALSVAIEEFPGAR